MSWVRWDDAGFDNPKMLRASGAQKAVHWCPNLWTIAVDTTVTTWHACWDHIELLPPWNGDT